MTDTKPFQATTREHLIHLLAEAAELEHNLMCTYLYAAFSLKRQSSEFSDEEAHAVARWRANILRVAVEEMGHLASVWNITSALGAIPQLGRGNFPLDPGMLPAGLVVKLVPFGEAALQHFVHLERPAGSDEPEGSGFEQQISFQRARRHIGLVPMSLDYDTVGEFYSFLETALLGFAESVGEGAAFPADPALQLSVAEAELPGVVPVRCAKTAVQALAAIVEQGEGAPLHSAGSHFERFSAIRAEFARLRAKNPRFEPAFPAAENPVLRPPPRASGRILIEDERAARTVDLANSTYSLMLRLLAYSYSVPRPLPDKSAAVDLSRGLMRIMTLLGERAASLPSGPSSPGCNAGMSFTAIRGPIGIPRAPAARAFFLERFDELAKSARELDDDPDGVADKARRMLTDLRERAARSFTVEKVSLPLANEPSAQSSGAAVSPVSTLQERRAASTSPQTADSRAAQGTRIEEEVGSVEGQAVALAQKPADIEEIEGTALTLVYEGKKCIHSRFCVTWGPRAFLANVPGPWIHPDAMDVDALVEVAHVCPSGAIRYRRKDGKPDESAPPVNLLSVREAGPYAVRAELSVAGQPAGFRATLCRCGASKRKPYCDGSHKEVGFSASGEPPTGVADMLEVRDGPLSVEPETDGPLQVRGNLEIVSGTGRVVARLTHAKLCRCGGSSNKPFCDGTHARNGFRSS